MISEFNFDLPLSTLYELYELPDKPPKEWEAGMDRAAEAARAAEAEEVARAQDARDETADKPAPQTKKRSRTTHERVNWSKDTCNFLTKTIQETELSETGIGNYKKLRIAWSASDDAPEGDTPRVSALAQHLLQKQFKGASHKCATAYDPYRKPKPKKEC